MIEQLSAIRDKLSFNIWFITGLRKKTVENILDIAIFVAVVLVALVVVAIIRGIKNRNKGGNK